MCQMIYKMRGESIDGKSKIQKNPAGRVPREHTLFIDPESQDPVCILGIVTRVKKYVEREKERADQVKHRGKRFLSSI